MNMHPATCMQKLVGLNFEQEAREADLRYGLVRVRENAESIAFYNGASSEVGLLAGRLGKVVANYRGLVAASRNLDFFQSAYRYIIILLPAAVVAPLYFKVQHRVHRRRPTPDEYGTSFLCIIILLLPAAVVTVVHTTLPPCVTHAVHAYDAS